MKNNKTLSEDTLTTEMFKYEGELIINNNI